MQTPGFRFVVQSYDPARPAAGDHLPRGPAHRFAAPPLWSWPTWEEPAWHAELKPAFAAMRDAFLGIEPDR